MGQAVGIRIASLDGRFPKSKVENGTKNKNEEGLQENIFVRFGVNDYEKIPVYSNDTRGHRGIQKQAKKLRKRRIKGKSMDQEERVIKAVPKIQVVNTSIEDTLPIINEKPESTHRTYKDIYNATVRGDMLKATGCDVNHTEEIIGDESKKDNEMVVNDDNTDKITMKDVSDYITQDIVVEFPLLFLFH